ncbi:hypothetical protein, variant [Cladophialophora immunda]|nr:hypothetical protein, variant [Cladophialophora immunda]KIW30724.1 hypothetical protein, variant [Cladophialophora immunda]
MPMIYKRFTDKTAEEWRQIYKALQLLEFLCKNGSERVIDDARSHLSLLRMLRQFHYIDQNGKDQGVNVRNRSAELVKLLSDVDTIRTERKKARANRHKYGGVEGGMGMGGGFSSSSRYGGFGSETGGFGGYQGEVYGDGGGFGGRDTDFSGTQRRGEQFEEYDEADDFEATRPTRSTTTRTAAPTTTAKRDPPKPKESEQDLFDFGDDQTALKQSNGKAPAQSSGLDDFGGLQGSTANDDDDFDDFQSATSPAVTQPASNPLAGIAPPPATSTTTSATQFAAPKPVAPGQAAGFNNIFTTASPAPSATSSIMSPTTSTFSPPPAQKPAQPTQPSGFKPSGPNYFTSVPMSTNSQPTATSNASTPLSGATPSYTSSTSAASLGKPASKPVAGKGGDAFGDLWSSASSKAGVKGTTGPQKGPDLASMAKAKSQAGIWGAASAASSTTPKPGAMASNPTTPSGQAKPSAPLGNGLDDLLG